MKSQTYCHGAAGAHPPGMVDAWRDTRGKLQCSTCVQRANKQGRAQPLGTPSFFDAPPPAAARASDPETSHRAATRVDTAKLNALVLASLGELGDATSHEVAAHTGLELVSISPRFAPLERALLVARTGARREGRQVWRLTTPEERT